MAKATVITDASFCPKTKAAGWAVWLSSNGFRSKQFYGPFKSLTMKNSTTSEFGAIINGMYYAYQHGCFDLLIQTDCLSLVMHRTVEEQKILDHYKALYSQTIRIKHVKGHSNSDKGAKYYCNNWCDKFAKKAMYKVRKEIENAKSL